MSKLVNYQHFVTLSPFLSLLAFYCWNILEQIFIVLLYHFKSFKILLFYHIAAMPSSPLENKKIILGIIWYILYVKFSIVCKIHLHIFIFISQDFNCLSYFFFLYSLTGNSTQFIPRRKFKSYFLMIWLIFGLNILVRNIFIVVPCTSYLSHSW